MKDLYVYENTDVLKNLFNIRDFSILNEVEKQITSIRIKDILDDEACALLDGNYDFEHFRRYHEYIFQDIYEWAGNMRTIDIEKSEIALNGIVLKYSSVKDIKIEIDKALKDITSYDFRAVKKDVAVDKMAETISNVWKTHAFREGNTRTVIMFFINMGKKKLNISLNSDILTNNSDYLRRALVASAYEDTEIGINRNFRYLKKIIGDSMSIDNGKKTVIELKKSIDDCKKNITDSQGEIEICNKKEDKNL